MGDGLAGIGVGDAPGNGAGRLQGDRQRLRIRAVSTLITGKSVPKSLGSMVWSVWIRVGGRTRRASSTVTWVTNSGPRPRRVKRPASSLIAGLGQAGRSIVGRSK